MTEATVVGPTGVAHVDHDLGTHERTSARSRFELATRGARVDGERRESLLHFVDHAFVEPASDFAAHEELALAEAREVERAEPLARPLPRGKPDDHELVVAFGLHLHPIARASRTAGVRRVRALGDDALELFAPAKFDQRPPVVGDVVEDADDPLALDELRQKALSHGEGERAQVVGTEREQIEDDVDDGRVGPRELELLRFWRRHAGLQPLEARPPVFVERDDFAVEHDAFGRERADGAKDLGERRVRRARAAKEERRVVAPLVGNDPEAVELELVEPALLRHADLGARAEHRRQTPPIDDAGLRAELAGMRFEPLGDLRALGELFDREPGEDTARLVVDDRGLFDEAVRLLQ